MIYMQIVSTYRFWYTKHSLTYNKGNNYVYTFLGQFFFISSIKQFYGIPIIMYKHDQTMINSPKRKHSDI